MRDIAINLRAQAGQRDLIDQAASQLGRNRSDFMLEAACEKARAFASFAALCDAPLQKNAALDALLDSTSPWDVKASPKTSLKNSPLPRKTAVKSAKRSERTATT